MNGAGSLLHLIRGKRTSIPPSDRLRGLFRASASPSVVEFLYQLRTQAWSGQRDPFYAVPEAARHMPDRGTSEQRMMLADSLVYLPDDILVKVDRAAMAYSLETRVPMLDHRVVEFASTLPIEFKIRGMKGKVVLREALHRHVPREIVDRPKAGFTPPLGAWLRNGELRDWAEELLSPTVLNQTPILSPDVVRKRWSEHLSGKYDWQASLWPILMMLDWSLHKQDQA
jgi:asparagine synthase (glutamine-hydrolysing)